MKKYWLIALIAITQFGCDSQPNSVTGSPEASPTPAASLQKQAIAKVAIVEEKPVFVNFQNKSPAKEIDAKVGMDLHLADIIRTEGKGKTQVEFNNGVGFRIAGDAILQIQPQNRLHLKSGKMITWVKPGFNVPTEISTSYATAAIRGTTAFVEIPEDINKGVRFFSWEGTVVVKLANQSKEIVLLTGEEVIVRPNSTTPPVVRRLNLDEWKDTSSKSSLLRGFKSPLPTQLIIDKLIPGQVSK